MIVVIIYTMLAIASILLGLAAWTEKKLSLQQKLAYTAIIIFAYTVTLVFLVPINQ